MEEVNIYQVSTTRLHDGILTVDGDHKIIEI
jgi:hypothetical protein